MSQGWFVVSLKKFTIDGQELSALRVLKLRKCDLADDVAGLMLDAISSLAKFVLRELFYKLI